MKFRFLHPALLLVMAFVMSGALASCDQKPTQNNVPVVTRPAATEAQMIPRKLLLQPPLQYQGRISPNGQKVSWLSMVDGGLNLFVADSNDPASAKQETSGKQGVDVHYWTPNSAFVLFSRMDKMGDRTLTWSLNVASEETHRLGPDEPGTSVRLQKVSGNWPNSVLVTIQKAGQAQGDLYRINLNTDTAMLVRKNTGYAHWVADEDLQPRLGIKALPDGGEQWDLLLPKDKARRFLTLSPQQVRGTRPLQLDSSGTVLYMLDNRRTGFSQLVSVDLYSGDIRVLAQVPGHSIHRVLFHPVTGLPVAFSWEDSLTEWKALDADFAPTLVLAREYLGPHFAILASTSDMRKLVAYSDRLDRPGKYSIINRNTGSVTTMFETAPQEMVPASSASIAVQIPARDGFVLSGYYTPPQTETAQKPEAAGAPLLIMAPDWPGQRFHFQYDPLVSGFTSRGYGVLLLNTRGAGALGNGYARFEGVSGMALAPHDLVDAANWARSQGLVSADQGIALSGIAFGGDAVLKAAQEDKNISCVMALDPLIHVPAAMQGWQKDRPKLALHVMRALAPGGPATLRQLQLLSVSSQPTLVQPNLLLQVGLEPGGAMDVLDQWAQAQTENGGQTIFATISGTGKTDRDTLLAPALTVADEFFGHCLGGKWEKAGDEMQAARITLHSHANYLPGISAALQAEAASDPQ